MNKVYNFSAGPAVMPEPVLKKAQSELLNYKGTGMSVLEMSHRSDVFLAIAEHASHSLRKLMGIPENYAVMFLQGGATLQFSMVPLNLLNASKKCAYINTGYFSSAAIKEARRYGDVTVAASSEDKNFSYIPDLRGLKLPEQCSYLHMTQNNTIFGTTIKELPDVDRSIPLVSDISSMILSEPIDVSKFGVLYAGAQKNVGPSGLTLVVIRKDLIGFADEMTPLPLHYAVHAKESMFNTPTTFSIYMAGLVFDWIEEAGGVTEIQKRNAKKAAMLYDKIDSSKIYRGTATKEARSNMNVTFFLPDAESDKAFAAAAAQNGLTNLKGHKQAGGIRASIYNAMPLEGVEALVSFMDQFEKTL